MGYGQLLSKEEREEFVKDLIKKNYNPKNTCYMESQIYMNLKGTKSRNGMYLWFITYDENEEFENDVYFETGYNKNEFRLEIKSHNARSRTGKKYEFEVDEDKLPEIFKKICLKYSDSESRWANEVYDTSFYEVLYDVVKSAKDIYMSEY